MDTYSKWTYLVLAFIYTGVLTNCFASFGHPDIIPIRPVGKYNILEMWHGPTGALKDLSINIFTSLIDHFVGVQGQKAVGVVGTLGDTGAAAIYNSTGRENLRLVVLFPQNGVSKLQRLSMTTVSSPFLSLYECECSSDEFDTTIETVFEDRVFCKQYNLFSFNSTNIGRVLAHMLFYMYTYLKICPTCDREVTMYVPTGGLGNIAGGCMVRCMGLPIKLVATVNENDTVHQCFSEGILAKTSSAIKTHACAIDSISPVNIERVLYYLSECNCKIVKNIMLDFQAGKSAQLPQTLMDRNTILRTIRVPQADAISVAKQIWEEHRYILCPHTAVAVSAAAKDKELSSFDPTLAVCFATATPAKFPKFVCAIDQSAPIPTHPLLLGLEEKKEFYHTMKQGEYWETILKRAIEDIYKTETINVC